MKNSVRLPSIDTHELAELVGTILGDGSIGIYECESKNKIKIQYKFQITCHSEDDIEYLYYIKGLFKKLFDVELHQSFRKNEKACDLRIFRREIITFFINSLSMDLAPKWNKSKIPHFYINSNFEVGVLRGYFDTDGSVVITNNNGTIYPRLEMKICPSPMQNQFIKILNNLGFKFGVYQIGNGEIRIQINGKNEFLKWVQKIGFRNPKHIIKVKKIAGTGISEFQPLLNQ
jgi:hypothetical protein